MTATKQLPEHVRARQWRERMGISRAQLAERSGYSPSMIQQFEVGEHPQSGNPISEAEWLKYRNICAAITARIQFDWDSCVFEIVERRKIDLCPKK